LSISLVQEFITLPESAGKLLLTIGLADVGVFEIRLPLTDADALLVNKIR